MRLSINIDDGLLKAVMDGGGFKTKKAAIEAGLQLQSLRVG